MRGHPALPFLALGPVVLGGLWLAHARGVDPLPAVAWFGGGWLTWTLAEYLMHRFFFHLARTSEARRVIAFLVHGHHHIYPSDRRRLAATPLQFASVTLLFLGVWQLAAGPAWPVALAGSTWGYLVYEAVHYRAHHGRPRTRLGRALRRHHLQHHHHDNRQRYGISSPLWDWILRTAGTRTPK
jgi:dihydroceramide fatty acyl 2-hydroxylase